MKRIFSKKSGFTLVEIVVAFAIFAIMSAMILSMVRLTVQQQNSNNEFADSIEDQTGYLAYHYIDDSEKYDTTESADGAFELKFYDKDGDLVSNTSMDYAMRSSVGGVAGSGEGINYFVGNTDYADAGSVQNGATPGEGDVIPGLGNSQAARYDTRLSGSKNIDFIQIHNVVKDTTYTGTGVRYLIECSAKGSNADTEVDGTVPNEDIAYLQYKFRFVNSNSFKEIEGTGTDGKTYTYKIYDDAKILDCGYVNGVFTNLTESSFVNYRLYSPTSDKTYNKYSVEQTSGNIVRIGIPFIQNNDFYKKGFQSSAFTRFYVVFDSDPGLSVSSFGSNGSTGKYTAYPMLEDDGTLSADEFNLNIYGAYTYEKTLKAGS